MEHNILLRRLSPHHEWLYCYVASGNVSQPRKEEKESDRLTKTKQSAP